MKTYLKTYFYSEHEIQWLAINLIESYDHISKFIICEYNVTCTGLDKKIIGIDKLFEIVPDVYHDKILYLPMDIRNITVNAYNNEELIHKINDPIMRSSFMKYTELKLEDEDIVISVDADEILYRDSYDKIKEYVNTKGTCLINLHQFFYKTNYFWKDKDFIAPIAIKYKSFKNRYPCDLRYEGKLYSEKLGCHFSWCMSPEDMIIKLHSYQHPRYRSMAQIDLLKNAIETKTYPFDKNVKFEILELPLDSKILPISMRKEKNDK